MARMISIIVEAPVGFEQTVVLLAVDPVVARPVTARSRVGCATTIVDFYTFTASLVHHSLTAVRFFPFVRSEVSISARYIVTVFSRIGPCFFYPVTIGRD